MKVTVVPAQVTTVEDKIVGNLNFAQMLLLVIPVFLSGAILVFLPPFTALATYKMAVAGIFALVGGILALRIRGKIVLIWIMVVGKYRFRPHE